VSTTRTLTAFESTGANRQAVAEVAVAVGDAGRGRTAGVVNVLTESVARAAFTDGGSTSGTFQLLGSLPAGAVVLATRVSVETAFIGDTSATLTIGDGSDVDRYNTGTPSVFTAAAVGVEVGVPSGSKLVTTENRPTLTITSGADFTNVSAGALTVRIYYLQTA